MYHDRQENFRSQNRTVSQYQRPSCEVFQRTAQAINRTILQRQNSRYGGFHGTAQATTKGRSKKIPMYDTPGRRPPFRKIKDLGRGGRGGRGGGGGGGGGGGLDDFIEQERRRRDRWRHQFGFNGERASLEEQQAESQRRRDFEEELQRRKMRPAFTQDRKYHS